MGEPVSATIEELAGQGRIRSLKRGERLIHEGWINGAVIVILAGTVRVNGLCDDGDEVVLAIRGPGDLLGDLGPISGGKAGATVEAREKGRVAVIPASRFVDALRGNPDLGVEVMRRLVRLLAESDRRRMSSVCKKLPERVAEELLQLSLTSGTPVGRDLVVTQAELASLCGASRSTVSEALTELRSAGMIDTGRGRVSILDPEGLRTWAPQTGRDSWS